jgi:hypothetical protein
MLVDPTSLVKTTDNINNKLLMGEAISPVESLEAARWITCQQGKKGSYRGFPAPTPSDFEQGIRTFTGEKLECASARHILGQEAARAVWLLGRQDASLLEAYHQYTRWMQDETGFQQDGTFCCGKCTLAFWRHYGVGDFPHKQERLNRGLQAMKAMRLGDGKWRLYPFFYAIYTLLSLDLEATRAELAYARPAMEKYLKHARVGGYSPRRVTIIQQALDTIR